MRIRSEKGEGKSEKKEEFRIYLNKAFGSLPTACRDSGFGFVQAGRRDKRKMV